MRPPLAVPQAAPELQGERVLLRPPRESDIDDRLPYPIDPAEEDLYGGSWRRVWKGQRFHTREHLAAQLEAATPPGHLSWCVEHESGAVGACGLRVDAGNHRAWYSVGIFVSELRGQGLGREITRLVANWGFQTLGLHRIELEVLTGNERAIRCYEAVGFRREGVRREAELYPDGWKDFLYMSLLASEWT
jgi:[ribosomal protein S5]-alanine N-acetyltransferase